MPGPVFHFKQFRVRQDRCALKVGTDGLLLGGWTDWSGVERVLDIGTGTGVLALIAAQRAPAAQVDAVEVDPESAAQAAENVAASPWPDRVRVHAMDVRRLRSAEPFDVVVCNPPYYAGEAASPDERRNLARHHAGLTFAELLEVAGRVLAPEGRFSVVLPLGREAEFLGLAAEHDLHPHRRCSIRYVPHRPPKRVLLELRRRHGPVQEQEITVEGDGPEGYDPAYQSLLSDLMTKF